MKKQLLTIALGLVTLLSVSTSFAADAKRYASAKGSIVVDGYKTSAFDLKGNLVYTIERYNSDALPKNIFDLVRNAYGQYFVEGIEKVDQPGSPTVYLVHMQNEKTQKTVRVINGSAELVQDSVKG